MLFNCYTTMIHLLIHYHFIGKPPFYLYNTIVKSNIIFFLLNLMPKFDVANFYSYATNYNFFPSQLNKYFQQNEQINFLL